ncbi:MAG TPA: isoamylase early set domain-containing protein [Gemmatimonadaceae bacterium]|nr:isoamylase early set domain-containing protein [Gemmatimonadaceae bacterium]
MARPLEPTTSEAVERCMQAIRLQPGAHTIQASTVAHPALARRVPRRLSTRSWLIGTVAASGLFAAGLAVGIAVGRRPQPSAVSAIPVTASPTVATTGDPSSAKVGATTIRFALAASSGSRVSVVGDFNGWDARSTPMTRDSATGTWSVSIPLPDGRYVYAFVVDGARWLPDPNAALAPEDDFGRPNSVLVVNTRYTPGVRQ